MKNKKSASLGLLKIVSQTHWWKKIYSKLKTVWVIIFQKCPILTSFLFIIQKRVKKQNKKSWNKHKNKYKNTLVYKISAHSG